MPCLRRGLSIVVLLALGVIAAWFWRGTLLRSAGGLWIVADPIAPSDAIVVLGGGVDTRPFAAADYYKRGLAKQILVADVRISPIERLEILPRHSDLNREVLIKLGVPAGAIVNFGRDVRNTYDEAQGLVAWAHAASARSVIVPTEMFSTRRVRWLLRKELGAMHVEVRVQSLPPLEYGIEDWWQQEQGIITFQNEVLKYVYYRFKY
jgi:uncharacterized SAM-binding protein YcdF (DUF218 family)